MGSTAGSLCKITQKGDFLYKFPFHPMFFFNTNKLNIQKFKKSSIKKWFFLYFESYLYLKTDEIGLGKISV